MNEKTLAGFGRKMRTEPLELAEMLLKVRTREGKIQPLRANPAQRQFEARRGRQNIVLKARQMGITTWIAGRFFLRTITEPGTLTLQVAHTQAAAEAIFRTVERMWRHLPQPLREGPLRRSRANAGQMVFPELDSEYRVGSACDPNVGRGLSVQNLHCSEVSRWEGDAAETLAGLRAALAPEGELVMESTPNGAYGAFYNEWLAGVDERRAEVETDGAGEPAGPGQSSTGAVVRHFLPWWMEPAYVGRPVRAEEMTEEECALVVRHGLSSAQIGFRRDLESRYGALRSQEFAEDAESCYRATGACCFDVTAIERRLIAAPEPVERRRGGALQLWLPALPGSEYIVAVDTAGGGAEGDFAAVQVIDAKTGLQCAELQERLRPSELARVAVELAKEFGGATIAVERNNHGAAVLAYLETNERYARVYRQSDGRQRGEAGFLTNAATKPEMIARLGSLLEHSPERFLSRRLLAECRTFVAGERGRTAAARGAHDDLVMAMAVAQAVRAEGLEGRMRP